MATNKKPTKREMFTLIANLNADNSAIVEFCNHEIDLLDNKKANGNTRSNKAVVENTERVYNALVEYGKPATPTELIAKSNFTGMENDVGVVTSQRISAYLNKLVESGKVTKYTDKKKTYFAIVTE